MQFIGTGQYSNAGSILYLPTSDVQIFVVVRMTLLQLNSSKFDSRLGAHSTCPFCELKKRNFDKDGLHCAVSSPYFTTIQV